MNINYTYLKVEVHHCQEQGEATPQLQASHQLQMEENKYNSIHMMSRYCFN